MLKGNFQGKLVESFKEYFTPQSPVLFHINGDSQFLSGQIETTGKTVKDEQLQVRLESDVALPGKISDELTVRLDWQVISESKDHPLFPLTGQGDFVYADQKTEDRFRNCKCHLVFVSVERLTSIQKPWIWQWTGTLLRYLIQKQTGYNLMQVR